MKQFSVFLFDRRGTLPCPSSPGPPDYIGHKLEAAVWGVNAQLQNLQCLQLKQNIIY